LLLDAALSLDFLLLDSSTLLPSGPSISSGESSDPNGGPIATFFFGPAAADRPAEAASPEAEPPFDGSVGSFGFFWLPESAPELESGLPSPLSFPESPLSGLLGALPPESAASGSSCAAAAGEGGEGEGVSAPDGEPGAGSGLLLPLPPPLLLPPLLLLLLPPLSPLLSDGEPTAGAEAGA
jgi:hypothetical protein